MSDVKQAKGRPRINPEQDANLDSYAVRLSAKQARIARRLGKGNLSEGIRQAVDALTVPRVVRIAKREDNPFLK